MTFDEWWKTTKPAECDEVKEHFEEAWKLAFLEGYQRGVAEGKRAEMNATEQPVKTVAQMYECRDAARRLLGDRYHVCMDNRARVIRAVAKRNNCNDIVAGATIIKETEAQGVDALLMMAAVVEMTEPSNA